MATHHAAPGEVVNLTSWTKDLPVEHSKVIAKTGAMELARLVLAEGEAIGKHHIDGPIVVHCLNGGVEILAMGVARTVSSGELLYLSPGETFTLTAKLQSLVLITFIFV